MSARKLHVLGVTGSIGDSASDLIQSHADLFDVQIVSAYSNVEKLAQRAQDLNAECAVIGNNALLDELKQALRGTSIRASSDLCEQISLYDVDVTVSAITGMAGLKPLVAAMHHSCAVAIANKEPLVAAGTQILDVAKKTGCKILPVDSEHNAIYQVFDDGDRDAIERIVITASGGAFRDAPLLSIPKAKKEDALKHPNWSMGQKITIDSATMMNKVLEVIEASVLFNLPADKIDVMIHPQSMVHGMVEYHDGAILAQLGASDMRTPIANVLLGGDERLKTSGKRLDFKQFSSLEFYDLDPQRYPAMSLAYKALEMGQYACIALNACNEITVEAFLTDKIHFGDITDINAKFLDGAPLEKFSTVEDVILYDQARRDEVHRYITKMDKK